MLLHPAGMVKEHHFNEVHLPLMGVQLVAWRISAAKLMLLPADIESGHNGRVCPGAGS